MLEPEQTGVKRNPVPGGGTLRTAAGIVSGHPALLRYDRTHPQTLSPDEIDRFVSQLTATKHRERAIVWLLKDGGVRIGEALSLQMPDIHWASRLVTVHATKSRNSRIVPLSDEALTALSNYIRLERPTLVTAPTGGKSTTDYDDSNWRPTSTVQLSNNTVVSKTKTEMNGRGQPRVSGYYVDATNLNNTAIEYDLMGRRKKVSMPYASSGSAAYWTEYSYDYLSRITEVEAPDGSTSKTFYNEDPGTVARPDSANPASTHKGQTVKSQDAWGRERWARTDAFGRLVEVVEPNPTGNRTVAATGSMPYCLG